MGAPLRLGVVGCGAVSVLVHLRNAQRLPGVEIVALADTSPAALARAAVLSPRATRHATADGLLAQTLVEAVLVATPSAAHADVAVAALESGRHLYVEKPVGVSVSEGERVVAAAAQTPVVAAVGFNRRFHPLVVQAALALRRGVIGPPVYARTSFDEPLDPSTMPEWKRRREMGGGAPLDLASHHVDVLRWLLDAEPVAVSGELRSLHSEHDDATLLYRFGGCEAAVECSFVRPRRDDVELEDGEGRTLRLSRYDGVLQVNGATQWSRSTIASRCRVLLGRLGDVSYRPALAAFVARARGGDVDVPTVLDGLASLRAILAVEAIAS